MHPFLDYATQNQRVTIDLIRSLVTCESPSESPAGVTGLLDLLIEQTRNLATPEVIDVGGPSPCLRLTFQLGGRLEAQVTGKRILGLGHADTVWPAGTLAHMPLREADGRLWGPGVLDMKAGLAFFISAVRLLHDLSIPVPQEVVLLVVPDEETGSRYSRALTEREARGSKAVLVLEPGTGLSGKLKTARKGVGRYTVSVQGVASHAGVDFEAGASAIVELARQVIEISHMTDLDAGTTVNPGVIRGGTLTNVIAEHASVDVDVRAVRLTDAEQIDRRLRGLQAFDQRCFLRIEGGLNRPPMERSSLIERLYLQASGIADEMGLSLEESATGGGSDGNFTAALGIPTLDGLGGVGEGAHAPHESILLDRIPDRVALLAGLLARL